MLRNGYVRVTCGADQQPPAFIFYAMSHNINNNLLRVADISVTTSFIIRYGWAFLGMSITPRGLSGDRDKINGHMMV